MIRVRPHLAQTVALFAALSLSAPAGAQTDAAQQQEEPAAEAPAGSTSAPDPSSAGAPAPDAPAYAAGDVVARVGETDIRLEEVIAVYSALPPEV